jgi:hypothetical protein
VPDNINKFELRIDNQAFEELQDSHRMGGSNKEINSISSIYKKVEYDPFSDFGAVAKPSEPQNNKNSEFGEFDFDSFAAPPPKRAVSEEPQHQPPSQQANKPKPGAFSFDNFDFDNKPKASNYETVTFQTNQI